MKKKIIIIVIIVVILGIAAFFIYKKVKKSGGSTPGSATGGSEFPLKQGSRGTKVENLQKALNKINPIELTVDGIFGPKTEADLLKKVGLKQLTKKQYEEFMEISAGYFLSTGLYPWELTQIQNA